MKTIRAKWGGLNVQVVEPDSTEAMCNVVLCHGFGAPGEDLVPLAAMFVRFDRSLADRVRFIFPEAALDLAEFDMPGGRAWWHLDVWKLQAAIASGTYDDLTHRTPAGLTSARDHYLQLLADAERATGIPVSRTVLGGFSQGAMISTDVSLQLPTPPAGLIVLSGSFINREEWAERLASRSGMPVLQSHGRFDQILPFEFAVRLWEALTAAGNPVEFYEFPGAHEIPLEITRFVAEFLAARISSPALMR